MAREATIRKKARDILEKEGYITWCPPKAKYQSTDIFGIFDCVAVKKGEGEYVASDQMRFIQWTTKSNLSARRRKILAFFDEHSLWIPCEIWAYDNDKKTFKIEQI
jgi:hypothetical protein